MESCLYLWCDCTVCVGLYDAIWRRYALKCVQLHAIFHQIHLIQIWPTKNTFVLSSTNQVGRYLIHVIHTRDQPCSNLCFSSTLHFVHSTWFVHVDALCSVIKDCFVPNSNLMSFGPFVMYKYLKFLWNRVCICDAIALYVWAYMMRSDGDMP